MIKQRKVVVPGDKCGIAIVGFDNIIGDSLVEVSENLGERASE